MSEVDDISMHTLTGAYAVSALPEDEQLRFEAHLHECPACQQEVRELRTAAAELGRAVATAPPPGLRARVLASIASVRQLPPPTRSPARGAAPAWSWRTPLGIAAAVLLAISLGLGGLAVSQQRRIDQLAAQTSDQTQRIERLLADPARVARSAQAKGGGTGTVIAGDGQALFVAAQLPAPAPGRAYQLWVIRGSQPPRPEHVLPLANGSASVELGDVRPADTIGLTVEPAGGSPAPTTTPILLVKV